MPLPFDLPALSRGFGELSPAARAIGREAGAAAARSLSALLSREVGVRARPLAGAPPPRAPVARIAVELSAVPAHAVLEVDPALVVRLVDLLAGGPGSAEGATDLTPVETAALELFALAALEGVCSVRAVEDALAPRLARGVSDPPSPLAVEIELAAGDVAGRARVLLPPAAVRALRGACAADGSIAAVAIPASLRRGAIVLAGDELDALAPGDVVVLDESPDACDSLVLPGGLTLRGRRREDTFHVEETLMAERQAQLPVTLEVELARIEIPLADLARLEPGSALPLGIDKRGLVTLRAGERPVARGELVDLDGAVGVRILSIEVAP